MSEKEASKAKLEPMVTAFRQKFSLSVSIDGDDCDASHDPLWMQYVMHAVEEWCRSAGIKSVALNASVFGRPLYESMGYRVSESPTMVRRIG